MTVTVASLGRTARKRYAFGIHMDRNGRLSVRIHHFETVHVTGCRHAVETEAGVRRAKEVALDQHKTLCLTEKGEA